MQTKAVTERIAGRYPSRWTQGYVRGKIGSDPAYQVTFKALENSSLPLLDIGCGLGFLAFYLRELGFNQPIVGLDYDEKKIERAREIAQTHYDDLDFRVEDAAAQHHFRGNVVVLDVLQYLTAENQVLLLQQLTTLVPAGGQCIIRGTPADKSWRFEITRRMDAVMHRIRWMKNPAVHYLAAEDISRPFIQAGFRSHVRPLWGKTPFNSHLFIFQRPG